MVEENEMSATDGIIKPFRELREKPIAPKDIATWNPKLSEVGMHHQLLRADRIALSYHGYTHVGHLTSIKDENVKKLYSEIKGLGEHMDLGHFRENIASLRKEFPKAEHFLAQPIPDLPCRPDGGRDGSGMFI